MNSTHQKPAGVRIDGDLLLFVNWLAREQQRSRTCIVNTILRWYTRWLAEQHQKVEVNEPVIWL